MSVALRPGALLLAALALAACDAEPGLPAESARPTLADVGIAPTQDSLETDAATARIPLTVAATLGGEGPAVVRVLVRYQETDSLVTSARADVAPGPLALDVPLVLPRGATGDYAVEVVTEGPDGRPGDRAAAVFHFDAASLGPPVVEDVSFPATVTRPAQGSTSATLVVTVSDPDGRENVPVVALLDPESGAVIGRLFDGGRAGGAADETAGDGRFSGALQIFADTPAGTFTLEVIAVDRSEAVSEPVAFSFEVR